MRKRPQYKPYCQKFPCEQCGKDFEKVSASQKVCPGCRKQRVRGYYVYGWYFKNDCLPYYIGKGRKGRAWRKTPLPTRVIIYRDSLKEWEAFLVEDVLINVFLKLGASLQNKNYDRLQKPRTKKKPEEFEEVSNDC